MTATTSNIETPTPEDQQHIDNLIARLRGMMEKENPPDKRMLRDAHPKMIGLVQAEFTIAGDLPDEFRVGIFAKQQTYQAWVRFSNASSSVQADQAKDIRGMAVKLVGVEGQKIMPGEETAMTQDFLMISCDYFLVKDIAEFDAFTKALLAGKLQLGWFFFNPFNSHLRVLCNLIKSFRTFSNLLDVQFYSVTPYQLGAQTVKYSFRPSVARTTPMPDHPSDDFLRDAMVRDLASGDVCFDLMIQKRTNPDKMPVDDVSVPWSETLSPFVKVATLRIPTQTFTSDDQMMYGDNLSFSPWHSLPEHRPAGGINLARLQIYNALSAFRHQRNDAANTEPTGIEQFAN